jgi:Uma2 family endonuclease
MRAAPTGFPEEHPVSLTLDPSAAAPVFPSARVFIIDGDVRIPADVIDLASFRRWTYGDDFPQRGRIDYLAGEIWVDMTMEQYYTHNQVKSEINAVLHSLVRAGGQGRYSTDGMRISHVPADLSVEPDGMFVSYDALRTGRVREMAGRRPDGVIELEGTPEMVLEVVSDSSVNKDNERLPDRYGRAGIDEFWRIDVRRGLRFEILRLTDAGYVPADSPEGWQRSAVFRRWFRLLQTTDPLGRPLFTLEVRETEPQPSDTSAS